MPTDYYLDIVGVLEGTDKSSSHSFAWDYLRKYERLFADLRDQPINLIEIGVAGGNSLKVWKSFFSRATIIGIDINPACAVHAENRVRIEIGSQVDAGFLARICAAHPPTIIIDDGSHLAHHVIFTFECMYPLLEAGGFYVVEDLNFHAGENSQHWRGPDGVSPLDYFGNILRSRLAMSAPTGPKQKYVFDNTDALTAIDGAIAFQKRRPPPAIEKADEFAAAYLAANSCEPAARVRFTQYLAKHWGVTEQAERAARKALEILPEDAVATRCLADFLIATERPREALAVALRGTERAAANDDMWAGLGNVQAQLADYPAAAAAFRRASEINPGHAAHVFNLSVMLERAERIEDALKYASAAVGLSSIPWEKRIYVQHRDRLAVKAMAMGKTPG